MFCVRVVRDVSCVRSCAREIWFQCGGVQNPCPAPAAAASRCAAGVPLASRWRPFSFLFFWVVFFFHFCLVFVPPPCAFESQLRLRASCSQPSSPASWMDSWGPPVKDSESAEHLQKSTKDESCFDETLQDDAGCQTVFTEQGASPSQMTAAIAPDAESLSPGNGWRSEGPAVPAYAQVKMKDAPRLLELPEMEGSTIWISLPRYRRPARWDTIGDTVVPLESNLYGHQWERILEECTSMTLGRSAAKKAKLQRGQDCERRSNFKIQPHESIKNVWDALKEQPQSTKKRSGQKLKCFN